jgi:hypothetical protein
MCSVNACLTNDCLVLWSEFPALEDVEGFVVCEAGRCGLEAVCRRRWRYGLGCLLFELTRVRQAAAVESES